jgi:ATP-dependent Clp protease ATP-binding subunit ClpC
MRKKKKMRYDEKEYIVQIKNSIYSDDNSIDPISGDKKFDSKSSKTPMIDSYGRDLTKLAEQYKLDPIIGREREIERLSQILSRRKKNNPVLIGEPGVGKSAIVEGLAQRIVERKISRLLYNKKIIMLDLASMVAGTKYRGQFEERVKLLMDEMIQNPDIILFIDELHTIVGAGGSSGSLDASNMFKPALARGELQVIGATSLDEYRKHIEKDGALERRFQKILVEPTNKEETYQILENIKDRYEDHHKVIYTEDAIKSCVDLSVRYITDRALPDKAIDVLDEAGSRVHISNITVPQIIIETESKIVEIKEKKNEVIKAQRYEDAANLRDIERQLMESLEEEKRKWEEECSKNKQIVNVDKISEVVSLMSGVPIDKISNDENQRLIDMEKSISSKVIGQDEAVSKIVKSIHRSRVGLKDPNRPIGSFMFLGPTGVGKSYLAKMLAKYMFDSEDSLIRVDMSEFMEKFAVSRLIGSPPGYVGHEEGGQLTEKVRRKPYSVILLDEIEKAHPEVFNLLLQVLDDGQLTDSLGRVVNFKNTIIIMTSNTGSRQLKDFGRGIGFSTSHRQENQKEESDSIIDKELKKKFAPEFLNRIDDVIIFNSLFKEEIDKIVLLEVDKIVSRLSEMGYELELKQEVIDYISSKGFDSNCGARPLKRSIQKYVEDVITDEIIKNNPKTPSKLILDYSKEDDNVTVKVVSVKSQKKVK